ncbi:MAG: class I SAM-dependent methyltransferase [Candidatus Yanofskybacteria bacterium]|nr:class I SAM-dependent methyltransferase [Candidatus Yanofskybacteria bacterium]
MFLFAPIRNIHSRIKVFLLGFLRRHGFTRLRYKRLVRIFYYKELFDRIRNIEGDIVECGVAYGNSLVIFGALAHAEGKGRRILGYDSFEGFPEPGQEDESFRNPQKGEYGDATMERVRKQFLWAGVPEPILVKGYFEKTVQNYQGRIALLHVDGDLYSSYKTVLESLYDKVVPGGIVTFCEYNEPKWPGAKQAVDEFFGDQKSLLQKSSYVNKYFLVKPQPSVL